MHHAKLRKCLKIFIFCNFQFSKIHNTLYFGCVAMFSCQDNLTMQILLGAFAMVMGYNAATGVQILREAFGKQSNSVIVETFLDEQVETEKDTKIYNDRLPTILKQNELSVKMFNKGWKFDLFNAKEQSSKVIAAASVIFAQLYFSFATLTMGSDSSLAITVFAYSMICLFSFMNVSYVRDFDVVQINFTPITLALVGITSLMESFEYATLGMTLALMADSYYALRYKETSDSIEYNLIELFAQESWTTQAFNKTNNLNLQIGAIFIIFAQLFLTMAGTVNGYSYQALFLSFYMARLLQFFFSTVKGLEMYQSNMTCIVFAAIAFCNMGFNLSAIQGLLMIMDAYIGSFLFVVSKNIEVSQYFDMLPIAVATKVQKRIRLVDVYGQ